MKGFVKLESVNPYTGRRTVLADWFPNTLLRDGMRQMGQRGDWLTCCQVGSNNTLPDTLQTGLLGYVAGTDNIEENVIGITTEAPYYGWRRIRWRYYPGSVSGILAEVGVGWGTTAGANLTSRALIRNEVGTVVTVTPLIDEYLDVTYEFRYYVPTGDATGVVTLDGINYNYIARAVGATDLNAWANPIGSKIASTASVTTDWLGYDQDISDIVGSGPVAALTADSENTNDYTIAPVNTQAVKVGIIVGPGTVEGTAWILTSGKLLRAIRVKTTAGWYQVQFDSQSNPGFGVPKTNQKIMQMQFDLSWSEASI
jgi:hypothetical protein